MYRKKSEIIGQIQLYHRQVAQLYSNICDSIEDETMKLMIRDLYELEKSREQYLERHRKIAEAMNCWLDFPCEKLSYQIAECFKLLNLQQSMSMENVIKIELHFDDCLIKLYNILASENELSESVATIFYYMLRKTEKEKEMLASMLFNSGRSLQFDLSVNNL